MGLQHPPLHLLRGASLFLDFDGTLVEIAQRPDAVRVDARVHRLMESLRLRLDGQLGVITGRPASQVRQLLGAPAFIVAGSHGLEYQYPDGRLAVAPRPPALDAVAAEMHAFASVSPGVSVEVKPLGSALHYRAAPRAEAACRAVAARLAAKHDLAFQPGKMVAEVRATGGDKGEAIRTLMAEPVAHGTRPVFLGDDDTDEPGFAAAADLGGAGIRIGGGDSTAAAYALPNVAAALDWLELACEVLA